MPSSALRLNVLGAADIEGPEPARRLTAQPRLFALLVYLALARPRGFHKRDRILGFFWPDHTEARARGALRTALHTIKEALGDVVQRRGDTDIALDPAALAVDAWEFDDAIARDELAAAVELYRGPLLDGFYPDTADLEHWLDGERERYRAAAGDAAWTLADRYESRANDLTSAARWARKAARLAHADERRIRRVMTLLGRAGDAAGAIAVYEDFARFLKRDLDIDPSEETRALARSLRGGS